MKTLLHDALAKMLGSILICFAFIFIKAKEGSAKEYLVESRVAKMFEEFIWRRRRI